MTEKSKDIKYLWLYLSFILNFVFAFLVGVYTFFDGIYYDSRSAMLQLQTIITSIYFILYLFSLISVIAAYLSMEKKKRLLFFIYILMMISLTVGSLFLSRVTVKLDPETLETRANIAPFFLFFLPLIFLIKLFLHKMIFSPIIKERQENGLFVRLQDFLFDKKKLENSTNLILNTRTMSYLFIWFSMNIANILICSFGIDFQNFPTASGFILAFIIGILLTTLNLLSTHKEKGLFLSQIPCLLFSLINLLVILSCCLATFFLKSNGSFETFPPSLSTKMITPISFVIFCVYISFQSTIFKAMKKNKKLNKQSKDCFNK